MREGKKRETKARRGPGRGCFAWALFKKMEIIEREWLIIENKRMVDSVSPEVVGGDKI